MSLNIGSRILLAAALIVVLTFIAFILYFDFNQRSEIRSALRSSVEETGALATTSIANWVNGRQLLIENTGQNIATADDTNADTIRTFVDRPVLQDSFMFTYYGSATGAMTMNPPDELPSDYDPRTRPWYKDAASARSSTLTEPYEDASTGKLIVTMATPVQDGSTLKGVVGGDIDITTLGEIVRNVDLGGIGYAFLVNSEGTILIHPDKDFTLTPMSKAFPENTPSVSQGLSAIDDSSGDQIFVFFPVKGLPTVKWSLGFAIDRDAAFAALSNFRLTAIITAVIAVFAIMVLLGIMVRTMVSKPVVAMTSAMTELAGGNKNVDVPGTDKKDEIGSMASAVLVFKENAIEMDRLAEENEKAAQRMEEERKRALNDMADSFEKTVLSIVETVAKAAENTQKVAGELTDSAAESNSRAIAVSNAAAETTQSVQTVAAATEELSAAIKEIGVQVSQSIQVASEAVQGIDRTGSSVSKLADAAQHIGEVVTLINEIADQTNLLALNATIEAARAGDAGKGFAVVASEVKSLASQTGKATEEIGTQVEGIQSSSTQSVDETGQIKTTIDRISEFTNAIAAAVEQQGVATREIADSVQKAATGTQEVSSNVAAVTEASSMVSEEAKRLLDSSSEMQAQAENLRKEVRDFLSTVRKS